MESFVLWSLRVWPARGLNNFISAASILNNLLAVYAPEEGKTEQTEEFSKTLQDQIDKINKNDYIIVAGDYNARVGKIPIDGKLCMYLQIKCEVLS
jgi:hypothetical protein